MMNKDAPAYPTSPELYGGLTKEEYALIHIVAAIAGGVVAAGNISMTKEDVVTNARETVKELFK